MLDKLMLITLAPILLWQGRKVRQTALRLPEATGARSGRSGQGKALRLLILGDSSAAGVGARTQKYALAGQLAERLSQQYQVTWQVLAKSGLTNQQLLRKLSMLDRQEYDCVVLAVGVNDVTAGTQDALWLAQLQQLREQLSAEFKVQHIFVSAIAPMQHFKALPRPLNHYLGRRAQRLNRLTERMAQTCSDLTFVPIELGVSPDMLAADGFHPSEQAYVLWAEQLAAAIKTIQLG